MNKSLQVANISLTSHCNLLCKHCGAIDSNYEMALDDIIYIIDRLAGYGVNHIIFSGGEPFCRKDIFEILDKCEKMKIIFAILTNGTMADPEVLLKLKRYKFLSYVRISVDYASSDKMDLFRGMKGIMKRIYATAHLLKKLEISFGIGLTIMDSNLEEIYQVAKIARDLGATFFRASPVVAIGKSSDIHHDVEFYKRAILEIFETRKKLNIGKEYPFIMLPQNLNRLTKNFLLMCQGGVNEISIMPDGSINRCPLSKNNENINIYKMTFDEAIKCVMEDCKNHETDYIEIEECKQCKYKERCKGGCYAELESVGKPLCLKAILESVCESCKDEYIRIYGNILYEQKMRGNYSGCMRSLALWIIPFKGI